MNLSGANAPLIKEYDTASNTALKAGEAVGLSGGLVVRAKNAAKVLGVCAEEHPGVHDELNARADGKKVRVNIAPDAVYQADLPTVTPTGGSATTLVVASTGLSTSVTSGYAVLVSKGEGSGNTDKVGTKRKISSCAISGSNATLTIASGGVPSASDVYMLMPEIGDEMYLDETGAGVCFYTADNSVKLVTVYTDFTRGKVGVKAKTHIFA